ncbi:MAG: site-2 protease family protein, partial [Bacteroidales bacterium]|nr:site-2 protease family protein [Bacteroidales bacterium]
SADDVFFERFDSETLSQIVDARVVKVLRDGKEVAVYIPEDMMERLMAANTGFATWAIPYVIDSVLVDKPAYNAGLLPGDSVISLDGEKISFQSFLAEMMNRKEHQEKLIAEGVNPHLINLGLIRDGSYEEVTLETDSAFQIGVYATNQMDKLFPLVEIDYGFFTSFPAGAKHGVNTLKNYVNNMKYVFSKEGAKQLGGFGTIGSIFPATWNWHQFWYMTAFLSIILAFMNILPIPALDGGHVMFLLYEIIARRKPSEQFMEQAQIIGMLILFALVIWANFNDVLRFFF